MHLRHDRCLKTWQPRPMKEISDTRVPIAWNWWGGLKERTKAHVSKCLPTSPAAIIRYVFPAATENAAISVASCESHLDPNAKNLYSSASGLFQLLDIHWAGRFNPFDPWANTRYAYQLSHAGYDWGAWVCKP